MSYYQWVEDVGEEVANALHQFLGQEPDGGDDAALPRMDVVTAMRGMTEPYHVTLDADVINQMADLVSHIDMGSDEDPIPMRGKGLKEARVSFDTLLEQTEYRSESVFRWFLVNSDKLGFGVADDDAMRTAYAVYWREEFGRLLKLIERLAMDRDNNDDQFYEYEAAQGEDDDA